MALRGHNKNMNCIRTSAEKKEPLVINTNLADGFQLGGRFTELTPIGFGANGLVFSAKDTRCDTKVAIKKISFNDSVSCRYALREIRTLTRLKHDNIVAVKEILALTGANADFTTNTYEFCSVFIVQELLDVDLHRVLQSQHLSGEHTQMLVYQLLRGLKYIHSANVIHRDLKPSNLLLNCQDLTLKIGDFGLARVLDPNYSHKGFLSGNMGTCWYRAPELLVTPRDYTSSVDIWSVGCIFAEMLLRKPLFPGITDLDVMCLVLDMVPLESADWDLVMQIMPNKMLKNHPLCVRIPLQKKMTNFDSLAVDLLEEMLTFNPAKRTTAVESLHHPYFQHLSCIADEPVALQPLHIEHEVDDLSPTSLKQMIISETCRTFGSCGLVQDQTKVCQRSGYNSNTIEDNFDQDVDTTSLALCLEQQIFSSRNNTGVDNMHKSGADVLHENCTAVKSLTLVQVPQENVNAQENNVCLDSSVNSDSHKKCQNIVRNIGDAKHQKKGSESDGNYKFVADKFGTDNSKVGVTVGIQEFKVDLKGKRIEEEFHKHIFRKKDAEKYEDDEKDHVEISTRKLEEDQEIESLLSHNETPVYRSEDGDNYTAANQDGSDDEQWSVLEYQLEKEMNIWQWMADVDKESDEDLVIKCNCLSVDVESGENQKEFSEPSPKELESLLKERNKNLKNERYSNAPQHPKNCSCNFCSQETAERSSWNRDNKQLYILDHLESRSSSKESLIIGARAQSPLLREIFDAELSNSDDDSWNEFHEKDRINQKQKLKLCDSLHDTVAKCEEEHWRSEEHGCNNLHGEMEDFSILENVARNCTTRDQLNSLEQMRLKRLIDRKNLLAPYQLNININRQPLELNLRLKLEDSSPEEGEFNWEGLRLKKHNGTSGKTEELPRSHRLSVSHQNDQDYFVHSSGASNFIETSCNDTSSQCIQLENPSLQNCVGAGGAKPKRKTRKQKQKAL